MAASRSRPHILSLHDPQPPLLGRAPPLPSSTIDQHRSILLEERLATQHREIHVLLAENQHLAATHVALGQEVNLARHEMRLAVDSAERVRAERDAEVREVFDRAMRLEAEARVVESMKAELGQVRAEVRELELIRGEMLGRLKEVRAEIGRVRAEAQRIPMVMQEIEHMHMEIQKGRAAIEYERKAHADNLEQSQQMEKNMIAMAQDLEKLQAELADAEKKARAAAAAPTPAPVHPGYSGNYGNPEMTYGGMQYPDMYNMQQMQHVNMQQMQHVNMQQVQAQTVANSGAAQYGTGAATHGHYDMQSNHVPR